MLHEKVLIVDDDASIRKILCKVLESNGLEPTQVSTGEDALRLIKTSYYDLILLDIMLEGMDGFTVLKAVREAGIDTPIMILSGRGEDYDTLFGLDIGADDYIVKPFNPIVLGAKVKALIRRNKKSLHTKKVHLTAGPFKYNLNTLKFYKNDEEICLSSKENLLMKLFLENINRVFSKEQIYEHIWGDTVTDENSVVVYISYLRNKIEDTPKKPQYLKTIWGLGYKFTID